MLKSVKLGFENVEVMTIPISVLDLYFENIAEMVSFHRRNMEGDRLVRQRIIGNGYIMVQRSWFETMGGRISNAIQSGLPDPAAEAILDESLQLNRDDIQEWFAQGLPDEAIQDKIMERFTDHFTEGRVADLVDVTLMVDGQPDEQLIIPWEDDPAGNDNQLAVNVALPDAYVIFFDQRDPDIHQHKQEKLAEFGMIDPAE
ncbi:hypothetical protein [Schleiferilactobacillus shenzhenensis]|uniref:Uncharacterized protein n=1 Tax=Schleiferilactobacillus shenzhenensis LY-73 TaxID=1231336 RepID=U4TKH7_9LACO|nr:hypothetical protein [Schleiferilactobacillus shenzhenensis]ERL63860.1 hypothetical protein L248_2094 [Schleiferilactobacillus shenzhenensis LY-73]